MKISNYFRYTIVAILLGSLFYTYKITIYKETIRASIDKKIPIIIDKKGFVVRINDISILDISDNIVESELIGTLKVNNFLKKILKKSIHIKIVTKTIPKLDGSNLSFELQSIGINHLMKQKEIKGFLKKNIENIKIPITKLKKITWFSSVKNIRFKDNGDLVIHAMLSKLIIFLLFPLFLLREIGLFLIFLYQKFLSPRKKNKCAKGVLYQDGTCSSTTNEAFKKDGFIVGMKEYKKSTRECKQAYRTINKRKDDKGNFCDSVGCSTCGGLEIGSSASACEFTSCASSPCDVASC
ncbi:MAG: hypothetical protein U9N11_06000 [Campylobacterota bacterium]|nr:hypothetical protein [Campylobacterota bacterium]